MSSLAPAQPTRRQSFSNRGGNRSTGIVRRPIMRRAKSNEMDSDAGSARVLIDYSKTRATHDAKDRSQCRGPQMSRQFNEPNKAGPGRSLSGRDLDWNALESTMNLSIERSDSSHEIEKEKEEPAAATTCTSGRPELPRRTCSARLRVNLARSSSIRKPETPEDDPVALWADEVNEKLDAKDAKGRAKVERSMSLGSHSLVFRRHPVRFHADLA